MDLRGHGESDWHPAGDYEYASHVKDVLALLDHLSIERVVLVAHSLGGRISMLLAGEAAERIAGLVIVDSAPEIDRRGAVRISMDTAQNMAPSFERVAQYETMLAHAYPAATPEAIARMARHQLKRGEDGKYVLKMDTNLRRFVGGGGEGPDAQTLAALEAERSEAMWKGLLALDCPVLVVRGAASDIVSADTADRMAEEATKQGKLAVVAQAGHSVMTDNPEGFSEVLCAFALGE
jgi:pimeloyl-ACP methyl ester carboxylesterase